MQIKAMERADLLHLLGLVVSTSIHRRRILGDMSSAPFGFTDYSKVDMLGPRYTSVNFGAKMKRPDQIGEPE